MWSLLARGGSAAGASARHLRRLTAAMLVATLMTGAAAGLTTALRLDSAGLERGHGGYSDIKLVRDFQLPTL